jgi:hypothetical protein
MACLKLSIGCLAVVGLVVVVLVLAVMGLFAFGVHHMFDLPERATTAAIEREHAPLLAEVRKRMADPSALRRWDAPKDLVAIRQVGDAAAATDHDLLTGSARGWASHTLLNGAGVATIDQAGGPRPCLLYELKHDGTVWWVYLVDGGPPASQGPE